MCFFLCQAGAVPLLLQSFNAKVYLAVTLSTSFGWEMEAQERKCQAATWHDLTSATTVMSKDTRCR